MCLGSRGRQCYQNWCSFVISNYYYIFSLHFFVYFLLFFIFLIYFFFLSCVFSFFSLLFILFLYNSLPLFYHYKKYNVEYNIYKRVTRHEYTLDTYIQNIYISIVVGVTEGSNGPWMFNYGRIFMELVRHIEIIVD